MKKNIFTLMFCFSVLITFAQTTYNFNKDTFLVQIAKYDSTLSVNLNAFFNGGYEKTLNVDSINADSLINSAHKYFGTPHCMGGTTTKCIDCSGLLYATFKDMGIETPHGSQEMARYGKIITSPDSLIRGDLVFFIKSYKTAKVITHSGFYMGEGIFIHASASSGVIETDLRKSKYWSEKFIFGTRIF